VRGCDKLSTFMCLNHLQPLGPVQACTGIDLHLTSDHISNKDTEQMG